MSIIENCLNILSHVVDHRIPYEVASRSIGKDRDIIYALCHGVLNNWPKHTVLLSQLINKPLKSKNKDVERLIRLGLFQIDDPKRPIPIVIDELVGFCRKSWAKPLINACLRRFSREQLNLAEQVRKKESFYLNHMPWFIDETRQSLTESWESVLLALAQEPKLIIRVNQLAIDRDDLREIWKKAGVVAKPYTHDSSYLILDKQIKPNDLFGYEQGLFYVQNPACHHLVEHLQYEDCQSILEIGAFPGGKTTDLLESHPSIKYWVSIDQSKQRYGRFLENLNRMKCWVSNQVCAISSFKDQQQFDWVVLDAPCSASGSVRHFSDYHVRKNKQDLDKLVLIQSDMIKQAWQWVKPGGRLTYMTCSIFSAENGDQISQFIQSNATVDQTTVTCHSILPNDVLDGMFFATMVKKG